MEQSSTGTPSTVIPDKQKNDIVIRSLLGKVVRDAMEKTVVVEVSTLKKHRLYRKQYLQSKRYKAHDPKNEYHVGDKVEIVPMRPLSKEKRWYVSRKIS